MSIETDSAGDVLLSGHVGALAEFGEAIAFDRAGGLLVAGQRSGVMDLEVAALERG